MCLVLINIKNFVFDPYKYFKDILLVFINIATEICWANDKDQESNVGKKKDQKPRNLWRN